MPRGKADENGERQQGSKPKHQPEDGRRLQEDENDGDHDKAEQRRAEPGGKRLQDAPRLARHDAVGPKGGEGRKEGAVSQQCGDHHAELVDPERHERLSKGRPLARAGERRMRLT